jgi:hypothetical protein
MRCCVSPTTSTAAETPADAQRAARAVMSAVLFREILTPLAQGLGPAGDIVAGAVADSLFVRRPR